MSENKTSDKQEKAKPLAYCILNRDGKMFWSESCIFAESQDGADELEAVQLDDPDAGWHIAPFYAVPSATLPIAEVERILGHVWHKGENNNQDAQRALTAVRDAVTRYVKGSDVR